MADSALTIAVGFHVGICYAQSKASAACFHGFEGSLQGIFIGLGFWYPAMTIGTGEHSTTALKVSMLPV